MNLAALIQQQSLAVLLAAIESAPALKAGETVQAKLLSVGADGTARALVAGGVIDLVLGGLSAKQQSVVPGSILQLKIDQPSVPGQAARATLLDVTAPGGGAKASDANLSNLNQTPRDIAASGVQPQLAAASARALAGPMLAQAAARQDSLAPLYATVSALPERQVDGLTGQVLAAASRLLGQRLQGEGAAITASELRQAVAGSGLFHEARLASGQGQAAQSDLKSTLLALKVALQTSAPVETEIETAADPRVASHTASAQQVNPSRPPLPRHDGQPVAQGIAAVALPPDASAAQVHKALALQTDAALDRLTLSQFASLPASGELARTDASVAQRWFAEVPLALAQGTAVLPFEIERDPPKPGSRPGDMPVWRVRFALDGEPLGPLHALVTMQGKAVNVAVWATREDTTRVLREAAPGLRDALTHDTFERAELEIFTGAPTQPKAASGQFLDRRS